MFIITEKLTNIIIACGYHLSYLDNGYPKSEDTNTSYDIETVYVYDDVSDGIPDNIEFNCKKYCYKKEYGY